MAPVIGHDSAGRIAWRSICISADAIRGASHDEVTAEGAALVEVCLREAQRIHIAWMLFVHGYSTTRPGKTTNRSIVRNFMRSKEATPLIERAHCEQYETVFRAKVKPIRY